MRPGRSGIEQLCLVKGTDQPARGLTPLVSERRQRTLNKSVRGLLASLAVGAIVVGCSSSSTASPAATAAPAPRPRPRSDRAASAAPSPAKQDITLTVMASQDWIKPAEQELAKQFEAADRDQGRLPDHPCRPVLQRPQDQAQRGRGDRHLRRPDRQVRPQAAVRRREQRGRPHRRGVDDPDRSRRPRPVQPRRQGLRRRDLGHRRVQLLRHGLQQGHLRRSSASACPRTSTSSRRPAPTHQGRRHHARSTSRSPTAGTTSSGSPWSAPPSRRLSPASPTSSTPTGHVRRATRT